MSDAHRAEIAKLETLYAENPEGRIFTHLAEAYRKAGDLERAREVLTDGIERHPDYSSAHVVLGRVLMDQGEHDAARTEFRRVLDLDSQNLVALRSLGDIARIEGRTEDALEHYRELLELEPSDTEASEHIDALAGGGEVGEAEESGEAVEVGPEPFAEAVEAEPVEEPAGEPAEESEPVAQSAAGADEAAEEGRAWDEEKWALAGDVEGEGWTTEAPEEGEEPSEPDVADEGAAPAWEPVEGTGEPEPEAAEDELEVAALADEGLEGPGFEDAGLDEPAAELEPVLESDDETDVMTETIAQVYARQGLYDRAAEVYRELVRRHPEDDALRARLEEMEAEAEPGESEPLAGEVEVDAEAEEAGAAEDTLEGFESGEFETGEMDVQPLEGLEVEETFEEMNLTEAEPEPEPEEELTAFEASQEPEPEFDATEAEDWDVADREEWDTGTDEVWSPEAEGWVTEPDEAEESAGAADEEVTEGEPAGEEAPEGEAPVEETVAEASVDELGEALAEVADEHEVDVVEIEEGAGEAASAVDDAAEAEVEAEPASPWTGEDWGTQEEAEATPYAWTEAEEEEADASPPVRDYLSGLLGWSGEGAGESAEPGAGEAAGEGADESGAASSVAGPGAGEADAPDAAAPGAGGPEDDEDLDMFRSWLESLKQ